MQFLRLVVIAGLLMIAVQGCGSGGGGGGGSINNSTPVALSAVQQNFEESIKESYYSLAWYIPNAGITPVSGTNYVYSIVVDPVVSPTKGTQSYIPTPTNLSATLSLPNITQTGITRVVKDGIVYARSSQDKINVYYDGGTVVSDLIASDGSTVMYSSIMDSCTAPIQLSSTDTIRTAPAEVDAAVGLLTHYNNSNFNYSVNWQSGSAYVKRTFKTSADTLFTYDWSGRTYDNNVNGSNFRGTLEDFFASIQNGIVAFGPAQYSISDGVISNISGVRAWVANNAAPASSFPTTSYYALYEKGGSIFVGYLRKANTRSSQMSAIDGTVLLDYSVRFNATAINSIKQTFNF